MARVMAARLEAVSESAQISMGWPAIGFVLAVAAAAVFSFSPRPAPLFAPTEIHTDRLLINGLAASGSRLVAVGDLGHILLADSPGGPWREAQILQPRGSMLTQIAFIDDHTALAVGHDGWILRSEDRGASWQEMAFDAENGNALLGIAGPYDGHLFAFGGFGELQVSDDAGRHWRKLTLDDAQPSASLRTAAAADPDAFPFGDSTGAAAGEDRHVYGMAQAADGSLVVAGERGLLKRSRDAGAHWQSLPAIYSGSFFGVSAAAGGSLVAYGMRGKVFRSVDEGAHWSAVTVPTGLALSGAARTPSGALLLVGDANTVLRSDDGGASFSRVSEPGRKALSTVLAVDEQHWLSGGEKGLSALSASVDGSHP